MHTVGEKEVPELDNLVEPRKNDGDRCDQTKNRRERASAGGGWNTNGGVPAQRVMTLEKAYSSPFRFFERR